MVDEFKERILQGMVVSHSDSIERMFEIAKKYIGVTETGKTEIKKKEGLKGQDLIMLYLIGRLYAKKANLSDSEFVDNQELIDELGVPIGSLLPWTKILRDEKKIERGNDDKIKGHKIKLNVVESFLLNLDKNFNKNEG